MKIRHGRKNEQTKRNLYVQLGEEPSDDDEYLGVIFDPARAEVIVAILNGEIPPFGG